MFIQTVSATRIDLYYFDYLKRTQNIKKAIDCFSTVKNLKKTVRMDSKRKINDQACSSSTNGGGEAEVYTVPIRALHVAAIKPDVSKIRYKLLRRTSKTFTILV